MNCFQICVLDLIVELLESLTGVCGVEDPIHRAHEAFRGSVEVVVCFDALKK
mgnify:CR=1 FL=1